MIPGSIPAKHLAQMAEDKGRTKAWGALGVGLWIVAEVAGLAMGFASGGVGAAYALGIGFALASAVISYGIVVSLPEAPEPELAPVQF